MTLKDLEIGESARITIVGGEGVLRQHFLDMGVVPGAEIKLMKLAPMGDPMEFRLHGYELTLRLADAEKIEVEAIETGEEQHCADAVLLKDRTAGWKKQGYRFSASRDAGNNAAMMDHPGLGEGGIYHVKADGNPLPEGTTLTFALAGNQNCGKTTLFNQLTGSNQHVGNFPGVTVDRKDGVIRGHVDTLVILAKKSLPDNFCWRTSRKALSILWMQRISSGICI